jgi:uncharacterized protein YbaR (Trm112 family)
MNKLICPDCKNNIELTPEQYNEFEQYDKVVVRLITLYFAIKGEWLKQGKGE